MPGPSPAEVLHTQMLQAWSTSDTVLRDIEEDDYWWEPATDAWSVRRREDAGRGWGVGDFVCEDAWPPPDPLPVTTIAWRTIHLAAWNDIYIDFAFHGTTPDLNDADVPGDMAGGLDWLSASRSRFLGAVASLTDDEVFEHRPVHWGEQLPVVHIVTSMIAENVHHIAEIGALRDIRRGAARSQPYPEPIGPDWWRGEAPDTA